MSRKNLSDNDALILEDCTLREYLTYFSENPTEKSKAVNEILREINLQDLKDLILKRIKLSAEILQNYSGSKKAKLIDLDFEINQKINSLNSLDLENFNNYVVAIFRASEQKIDKSISMLDFYNLENQVQEEYKRRVIKESQTK